MQQILQGHSSREAVLASLEYLGNSIKHQVLVEDWIKTALLDKLEVFISYIIGSNSLRAGQKIKVNIVEGQGMTAHACFDGLELPNEIDKDIFYMYLNTLEPGQEFDTV
jgi:hypothetical protein